MIYLREIDVNTIGEAVAELCVKANKLLPDDLAAVIGSCRKCEKNGLAESVLGDIEANLFKRKLRYCSQRPYSNLSGYGYGGRVSGYRSGRAFCRRQSL